MLTTPRLLLRPWQAADRPSLVALNADPAVMRHFPALMSAAETDAMLQRIHAHFAQHGYGLWAAELRATGECIGYIGLNIPRFQLPFSPCVEIGWRLAAAHWNQGLATEGALAAMEYGFQTLGLSEIVSFTTPANLPSRRVMEKIGMTHNPAEDFDHPALPEAHPLRRHVLYRRSRNGSPEEGAHRIAELAYDFETDLHGHLKLLDRFIYDPASLIHHLKPIHVVNGFGCLRHGGLYRFGKALTGGPDDFDDLVDSWHSSLSVT